MTLLKILVVVSFAINQVSSNQIFLSKYVQGRIINGWAAKENQFNYEAVVFITRPTGNYMCAGSLIHPQWVLTAAHCLKNGLSVKVRLGSLDRGKSKESRVSKTFFIHPEYNKKTNHGDVGLIYLGKHVEISEKIRPIRIAPRNYRYKVGEIATVSGWGLMENGKLPKYLKFALQKIVDHSKCAKAFRPGTITEDNFCTAEIGNEEGRPCSGDSGGPVVVIDANDDKPTLIGMHIASTVGCLHGKLTIHVKPQFFLDWIEEIMKNSFES